MFTIERLHFILILVAYSLLTSCGSEKKPDTYFGGKIISPKSDHIILFYQEKAIDTFQLDENHSFLSKIKLPKEGLYYFKHGPEHQYIYFEPSDSILIRLNTWSFDESLVFSGKGADRNNMLIDCFIDSEEDDKKFYQYYQLDPENFKKKISEIEHMKMARFEQFLKRHPEETEQFKGFLKMALTYPLYTKVEKYPLAKRTQSHTVRLSDLDSTFYSHRSKIQLNQDSIMFFYAYRDFVISHIYNIVFSGGHDIDSDGFTIDLMKKINQHITYENTKNTLLRQIVTGHFYRKSSCNVNENAFDTFFELSTSHNDKELIEKLLKDVKSISKGSKLKSFTIVDANDIQHDVSSVIKEKNSVIYFWNPIYISKDYLASKVNYLSKKYPNVNFIGIKITDEKFDRILNLDIKSQYYLHKSSDANAFLTSKMPRTILVNKEGVIVNGFASLSSQNIYNQIGELAKK